jgi:hypothetical protein
LQPRSGDPHLSKVQGAPHILVAGISLCTKIPASNQLSNFALGLVLCQSFVKRLKNSFNVAEHHFDVFRENIVAGRPKSKSVKDLGDFDDKVPCLSPRILAIVELLSIKTRR